MAFTTRESQRATLERQLLSQPSPRGYKTMTLQQAYDLQQKLKAKRQNVIDVPFDKTHTG